MWTRIAFKRVLIVQGHVGSLVVVTVVSLAAAERSTLELPMSENPFLVGLNGDRQPRKKMNEMEGKIAIATA